MTSQLVIFRVFFSSPDPKSEKIPVNQLIKKFWPNITFCTGLLFFILQN